jgi:regulator of protease activity HflC (stomatin/prohibitin superfamily)
MDFFKWVGDVWNNTIDEAEDYYLGGGIQQGLAYNDLVDVSQGLYNDVTGVTAAQMQGQAALESSKIEAEAATKAAEIAATAATKAAEVKAAELKTAQEAGYKAAVDELTAKGMIKKAPKICKNENPVNNVGSTKKFTTYINLMNTNFAHSKGGIVLFLK